MREETFNVGVVLVTFKRPELLRKSLGSLVGQGVAKVLVINNGGEQDPDTCGIVAEFISRFPSKVRIINTPQNVGGAGGFALGIESLLSENFDFVWLMDDDCIPQHDALEKLLKVVKRGSKDSLGRPTGLYASKVLWTDGNLHRMNVPNLSEKWLNVHDSDSNSLEIKSTSFVSCFIPIKAVRKVGLPIREFFIWNDDVEYTLRISRHFGYGKLCLGSEVIHATKTNEGVNFGAISGTEAWKYKYALRNHHAMLIGQKRFVEAYVNFLKVIVITVTGKTKPLVKIRVLLSAFSIPKLSILVRKSIKNVSK